MFLWSHASPQAKKQANSREVFGSDLAREVCFMKLPCPRVRLVCKPRQDKFVSRGDTPSTSDCCYYGIPMLEQESLPRIARDKKVCIMDLKDDAPSLWNSAAVPLFWNECVLVYIN